MKQTGIFLVKNEGQLLSKETLEEAAMHNDTAFSATMAQKGADGKEWVSVSRKMLADLKNSKHGTVGTIMMTQEKYKDKKIVFWFGSYSGTDYKPADFQPYTITKNLADKPALVLFVDGQFKEPGKDGDGYSGQYREVQDLLIPKIMHLFEDTCESKLERLMEKIKTPDLRKDLRLSIGSSTSLLFMAESAKITVLQDPELDKRGAGKLIVGDVPVGWRSMNYSYKAPEPVADDGDLFELGETEVKKEPPPAAAKGKTEKVVAKAEPAKTSVPASGGSKDDDYIMVDCPWVAAEMNGKNKKRWMTNRFGQDKSKWPKKWEEAKQLPVLRTIIERLGSNAEKRTLEGLKSTVASVTPIKQPAAQPADGKPAATPDATPGASPNVNPDLPVIPANHLPNIQSWQRLPYVAAFLDQKGKKADDIELLKSFQSEYPPFHDSVGQDKDDMLAAPFRAYVELGSRSVQALALSNFSDKLELLRLRAKLTSAGIPIADESKTLGAQPQFLKMEKRKTA